MSDSASNRLSGDDLVTAAALSRVIGVSPARLSQLKLAEGMRYVKTAAGDRFPLAESVQWYFGRYGGPRPQSEGAPVADRPAQLCTLDAAKARKAQADAELAELALAERRGALVHIDDVVLVVAGHVSAARSHLLAMPAKLSPLLAVEETAPGCQLILEQGVREALEELARMPLIGPREGGAPPSQEA